MPHPVPRNPESCIPRQVLVAVKTGLKKGWSGLIWLVNILVPISFATALMVHYQLLHHIDFLLRPMMTLIAVFTLISHNLIQESLVQANSGLRFSTAVLFRLGMSFVVTMICGWIMGVDPGSAGSAGVPVLQAAPGPLSAMLIDWTTGTAWLCLKILCIIMPLMVVMELVITLFFPLGLPAFWLWVPRLVAAMAAVWLHMGFSWARRFYAARSGYKKLCDY